MARLLLPSLLLLLAVVAPAWGVAQKDVIGVSPREPALKVIDEKCLACHNRQRIESTSRERRDMEKITRRMEKKGVVLTEEDRKVLGHFWQKNPFKGGGGKSPPPRREGEALPR